MPHKPLPQIDSNSSDEGIKKGINKEGHAITHGEIRVCTVVKGNDITSFFKNFKRIKEENAELIELRVDYIEKLSIDDIELIYSKCGGECIFTCRRKDEGGHFQGSEPERMKIIKKAIDLGFEYVDIELKTVNSTVFDVKNTKVIVSYHNFDLTPSEKTLKEKVMEMRKVGADIMKFAVKINKQDDIERLAKILVSRKVNEDMIVIGMGQKGKITRVIFPLLGSYLTFASVDGKTSAPGQIDIKELDQIYNKLI
jgi:3-dehydroquinate dehydratase-1